MKYLVNDIYPCIQGEGVNTGIPMILLRLHGCSVGCPWCDTKETWEIAPMNECQDWSLGATPHYTRKTASEINLYLRQQYPAYQWVLITGGEPAQYDLAPLVLALHDGGYQVAVETSGTETGHLNAGIDWICISPKFDMPGGKKVLPEAFAEAHEIKQVIGRPRDIARLDSLLVHIDTRAQICLQPVSQSKRATALCIQTVQERGWRLSLQTHKFISQR